MTLEWFKKAALVTKETRIAAPRFPVIDAHNHLGEAFGGGWDKKPVTQLVDVLDTAGVYKFVDLDGGWGEDILYRHMEYFKTPYPDRFKIFGGVDWSAWPEHGDRFGEWAAGRMRDQAAHGVDGFKFWKPLGLSIRDPQGDLVAIDDPRLDPIDPPNDCHVPSILSHSPLSPPFTRV